MRRRKMKKIIFAFLACLFAILPRCVFSAQPLVDPMHGIVFTPPAGEWEVMRGFGDDIAAMNGKFDERIRMDWISTRSREEIMETMKKTIGRVAGGARVVSTSEMDIGAFRAQVAAFETAGADNKLKVAVFYLPLSTGGVQVICSSAEKYYLKLFFDCVGLVEGIRISPVPHEKAESMMTERSMFAHFDGRDGCPGVSIDPEKLAAAAKKTGDRDFIEMLNAEKLEREGHLEKARLIYERVAREGGNVGDFAKLMMVQMELGDGDAESAKKMLEKLKTPSLLNSALKIWAMRMDGNSAFAEEEFQKMRDNFCGRAGAFAFHQAGLAIAGRDPAEAKRRFRAAIDAWPSHTPAYISLARQKLGDGQDAAAAVSEIKAMLARAPATAETERLMKRLERFR